MKILVSGSSGLVGSALASHLESKGHEVYRLVRGNQPNSPNEILWNPEEQQLFSGQLEGFDAIVNLAGDPIAEGRWNQKKKQRILDSRVQSTQLLSKTIASLERKPKVLINASAVGFYGDAGDTWVTEVSPKGSGFLSDVCEAWEKSADLAAEEGVRVVKLRFGVILSSRGGALKQMLLPFKLGLGGVIGSGKQFMSWIMLKDVISVIEEALSNVYYSGPINVVTEDAVTNREFTKTLGRVLKRPTILPMPAFAARLAFGEVADALLLSSCRVQPQKLEELGFRFRFPTLEVALQRELL